MKKCKEETQYAILKKRMENDAMTKRELVIKALTHQETAVLPYHMEFTQQALKQLIAYTGDSEIEKKIGSSLHYIQYWGWPTEMPDKPGYFKDDFGVEWNRNGADKDIGLPDEAVIKDFEDYEYTFPQIDEKRLRAEYEELIRTREDRFTFIGFGFCMFERLWSLTGMENALMSMITCPDELETFLDRTCDYMEHLVEIALEYDIDAVYFGDDWGQQKGLIMGPAHWRRFIKPRMARLYAKVKEAGKFVIQHSCGDCREILPDLIEIGLDCYQTFQPEIYDIHAVKEQYGDKLAIWGGISTQQCLPTANAKQIQAEAKRIADVMRRNGGYILAPTHAIAFDVPPENILALADVFHNQDKYLED